MLASLLLFSLASGPVLGPTLPAGENPQISSAALAVEDKLYAGDFAGATKAAELLPKYDLVILYDDSKVPAELRDDFAAQRDAAFDAFRGIMKAKIRLGSNHPDLKFSFEPVLANPPDSGIPAGAVLFWSSKPGDPRLETVIGLKRGTPAAPINPVNVRNEIQHALGAYYGLSTSPFPGTLMGRTDIDYQRAFGPTPLELLLCNESQGAIRTIRQAVKDHVKLIPTRPKVFFQPKAIEMGWALQGDPDGFQIQITNNGNAPLAMRFNPDCGCVSTNHVQTIDAGASYILQGYYDTLLTVGEIHHTLLVTTNDIDNPVIEVPVHIKVHPSYRFLVSGGNVINLPESGKDVTLYMLITEGAKITPGLPQVAGIPGSATIEPWSGTLADPDLNEGPLPRKGYKVTVHLDGKLPAPGRDPVTVYVPTDNKKFPTIQANLYAQRGIVVSPPQLYMGEIGVGHQKFSLIVSGPAKTFHVTKVSSEWQYISFSYYPNADGSEYHIDATYNGKAPQGPVVGTVRIDTDDPKQPTIYADIQANVK
jgi:hypothetical protein